MSEKKRDRSVSLSAEENVRAEILAKSAMRYPTTSKVALKGETFIRDPEATPRRMEDVKPLDSNAYAKAVDNLHRRLSRADTQELSILKRAVEKHLDPDDPASSVVRGGRRREKSLSVPRCYAPDHRAFEKWLVRAAENDDFVPTNFGFWCSSELAGERIDLDVLGLDAALIARLRAAINPNVVKEPRLSAQEFLAITTGIPINLIEDALEFLRNGPSRRKIEMFQKKGSYLTTAQLDRCIDTCRSWHLYSEPGADIAAQIVGSLFTEMNRRGVSKAELAERSGVAEKTLDTWNHSEADKRTPPQLSTIAACLEAIGLRLIVVPEAEITRLSNSEFGGSLLR